jgi:flavin reductase (DIM6/NTAB) family NADH-FMN oxidoreductase RutF
VEYQSIKYNELSDKALQQLSKGAFFTTKVGNKVNTMTIAWGGINIVWNKPFFVAYVRFSRDSYNMVEESEEFTISIPIEKNMKKELSYCGTKSGRDVDKIKDMKLSLLPGRQVETPILSDCELHYECKVTYKLPMKLGLVPEDVRQRYYNNNDYHMIYYGEIVDSYLIKGEK